MTELPYAALRDIMYARPVKVWLATENSGDRWLHDQWVMLNVTGHSALRVTEHDLIMPHDVSRYPEPGCPPNCPALGELPDGAYTLTVSKGLQPRDSIPQADLEAYFAGLSGTWLPARPTEWSVAEHPGKAMLWHVQALPALLGESTWTAIKRHYPECEVQYLPPRNLFSFCFEDTPFAYAAGIQIPDGQEQIAREIARFSHLTQLATDEA